MSLTSEQIERWRATIADGQDALRVYLATAEGQADPEVLMLLRVNAGLVDGVKLLRFIIARRRIRELTDLVTALTAEATALAADLSRTP
jgi:hypothetical protein